MQFLKELWFVLLSAPALYHRYEKNAIWAALFLLISIASFLVEHWFPRWVGILVWGRRASLGLSCLLFILAFVDLAKSRLPFDELVCSDIAVDAYYHLPEEKSYELVQRQQCMNRTDHPIRELHDLRDGYYEKIPDWKIDASVVQGPAGVRVAYFDTNESEYKNYIGDQNVYLYWRKVEFDPPLASGTDVDMVYRISAKGVPIEAQAFSTGTVFYRGVDYDTLTYRITIHAPPGYRFDLLDWGVVDSNGRRNSSETERQKDPRVKGSGGDLEWRVILARKNLSYMMKYKIVGLPADLDSQGLVF
jgi:hypothetical protein